MYGKTNPGDVLYEVVPTTELTLHGDVLYEVVTATELTLGMSCMRL